MALPPILLAALGFGGGGLFDYMQGNRDREAEKRNQATLARGLDLTDFTQDMAQSNGMNLNVTGLQNIKGMRRNTGTQRDPSTGLLAGKGYNPDGSRNNLYQRQQPMGTPQSAMMTPQQRQGAGLAEYMKLDPAGGLGMLKERLFAPPPSPITVNDQLVDPLSGRVIGDYRTQTPPERKILKDAQGRQRYADTGEYVFSDVQTQPPNPFTDIGKLKADLDRNYITQAQYEAAVAMKNAPDEPNFDQANTLRKEFDKASAEFIDVRNSYGRVLSSLEQPSAAGDISMIFNFMKMNDPGSTVREGEFATAQNAGGIPQIIRAKYNSVINGERLSEDQRFDFAGQAKRLYQNQLNFYRPLEARYTYLAQRAELDPADVVTDYTQGLPTAPAGIAANPETAGDYPKPQTDEDYTALESGALYIDPDDGRLYRKP